MKTLKKYWINGVIVLSIIGCSNPNHKPIATIQSGYLEIQVDDNLHTSVNSSVDESKPLTNNAATEYLVGDEQLISDYQITSSDSKAISDQSGDGTSYTFTGVNNDTGIEKTLTISVYDDFPEMAFFNVSFTNSSEKEVLIKEMIVNGYQVLSQQDEPPFWAFQGSSSAERADWIKPVTDGFYQENYMGMNNSDYGGGIPVTDIWRKDLGIAVGHTELTPKLISLPTELKKYDRDVSVGVSDKYDYPYYLQPGESIESLETFVTIHEGDYYNALSKYSAYMQQKGIILPASEPAAYESVWCAWGYGRKFNIQEVLSTLPKVKEFGIQWAVLDDGFQIAEGDWKTNKKAFPGGDKQMKEFVDKIHEAGLKAKLWWAPLAADPTSNLLQEHPEARLYLEDWSPQYITWWDAYYLGPTNPITIDHTKEVVNMFINEWGFDGLKLDGQHMNAVAPDHNPKSGLEDPVHAPERLPEFFKLIYDETLKIKPHAVVENCPCGTCMSFFNMPYMNQAVSSDPMSSWQIRHKGKTYKALIPQTAYYGDHVELSDNGNDFASSFGVGAVLGTKFVWPKANEVSDEAIPALTKEDEKTWKKWFDLYHKKMLSKEPYLGDLYDIGYDKPETHVIQKGDTIHYAFYAENWDGQVEFRGLSDLTYEVRDYVTNEVIGEVSKQNNQLAITFEQSLLTEVYPK
ncbi:glycoside hydrolase family 36 protein [Marinoscillum sp.]|uniref:glycoside hydrolase family 36 protein n=1 Tax=Marinoscillum sp. TaxID=2024838 RepID=UPI003BA9745D